MDEAWSPDGINANMTVIGTFNDGPARADELKDIDGSLLFLCSDASVFVTGQVLMVDGRRSVV